MYECTKENVDKLLRLRIPRHRQTPNHLKRVIVHAIWREPPTSVLDDFKLGDLGIQESKSGCSSYIVLCCIILAHRQIWF